MTTTEHIETTTPTVPLPLLMAVTAVVLLCVAPQARAAATSHATGSAVALHAAAFAVKTASLARVPRGATHGRGSYVPRGIVGPPLVPFTPRATRRYKSITVVSLVDTRRPQLENDVEQPRVHVKRRSAGDAPTPVARRDDRDESTRPRDGFTTSSSRRGPPAAPGDRCA